MNIHETKWVAGDTVRIDDDPVHCRVLAVLIRGTNVLYELAWMNNGESRSAWIEDWRMSSAETVTAGF